MEKTSMKPDFLICGAQKAGTSSLRAFLSQHPKICMPITEPHYYDRNYDKGNEWYAQYFKHKEDFQLLGEKTADYHSSKVAPERIYKDNPNCKLIFLLRNPVTRAYSQYRMDVAKMATSCSLKEYVTKPDNHILRRGLYAQQFQHFLKYFNKNQIHIIISEQFRQNKEQTLKETLSFLGLDPSFEFHDLKDRNVGIYQAKTSKILIFLHDKLIGNTNNRVLKAVSRKGRETLLKLGKKKNNKRNTEEAKFLYKYFEEENQKLLKMFPHLNIKHWSENHEN